ncbi:MAG: serine--tRNA ligase [Bacteroidia bacterium]|nr:serine--tRNA ligase [Bacteroidia bacterium]MDW8346312.1 serine--tRNA ligase [Bacteroidia bacterium]
MLTLSYLRQYKSEVIERLKIKHFSQLDLIDKVLELDEKRRQIQKQSDDIKAQQNQISKQIGQLFAQGKKQEAEQKKAESASLKNQIEDLIKTLDSIEQAIQDILVLIPNTPHSSVPQGKTAENNIIIKEGGKKPILFPNPLPHWELAKKLDIIDFELGAKVAGAGFPVYKGKGAKLERSLINFFLDKATAAGYQEVIPPIVVNKESGFGTGQLPDKDGQMYYIPLDELYLIPTAEVPITNLYRDTIIEERDLPIKNCGYTPCFRREAGSYGAHVRGLNRLHQFDKIEIVQITKPEDSYSALQEMCDYVESLLIALELPYRIVLLCGGDMSFASAKTYDFEVYSAAQDKWLEVSSVSNFETFQSNRLKLRYRSADKKNELAHTLNGSALGMARVVAALIENNQTEDAHIQIPACLQPYTGFEII